MRTCLDDEAMLGLVEGRLAGAALDAAEGHLDECATCRDVVAQMSRSDGPSPLLERGREIGRYVVGELLGEGAMGRVYSAWQPELDRRVAIKVLHDHPDARDRLLKEAQAMARLDHPNVVGVHEVGTLPDGGVFAVMDLVEGDTLRAWAPKRAATEIVRVLIEIARGLAAVHATGVIHRDIKPDNIIVGDGRARLGDFGLARGAGKIRGGNHNLADSASFDETMPASDPSPSSWKPADAESRTRGTSVAGTPVYMALEVLRGDVATPASDQFAFGVTAYEILAGERPFTGKTWEELAAAVAKNQPPLLRDVPGWLDAAIRRCLAADPAKRFSSMTAVADHLAEREQRKKPLWIAGAAAAAVVASGVTFMAVRGGSTSVEAGPSCALGASEIAAVWNRDVRIDVDKLGAPAIAAIDGWTAQWASAHDATCTASRSEPIAKVAARERCLVRQRDELAAMLERTRGHSLPLQPVESAAVLERNVQTPSLEHPTVERSLSERVVDALATMSPADCRHAEAGTADPLPANPDRATDARTVERELPKIRAAIALGDAKPMLDFAASMVERAKQSMHSPSLAEALLVQADALRSAGRFDEAAIAARDSVAAAERGHDDQMAARAWLTRVGIAGDRRDFSAADDLAAIAAAAVDRAGAPPRLAAQMLRLRGLVAYYRGRLDEAKQLLTDTRSTYVALSGEQSTDVSAIETLLGGTARAAGDLEAAERHHRAALAIDRAMRASSHPDLSRDLHNLAGVLRLRKQLDLADATYREALAIETTRQGARSAQAGLTHNSLGLVKLERRDWKGARAEFELALAILTDTKHGDRAFAEHNLGLVAAATNNHAAALASFDRAAEIYHATIGSEVLSSIRIHLDRARSLVATGQRNAARAEATRALEAATKVNIPWIVDDAKALLAGLPAIKAASVEASQIEASPPIPWRIPPIDPPPLPPRSNPDKPAPIRDVGTYGTSPGTQ